MVSMTDYMQQKMIQESASVNEVEKTEEELSAAVLESYLSTTAAFAKMECVCECANIIAFCESAEVAVPAEASTYMESFWDGVKNVFETVIDWFRSVISAIIGLFASSKLQKLIAKLKQSTETEVKVDSDVGVMVNGTELIIGLLEEFKQVVIDEAPIKKDVLRQLLEELEKAANTDNWSNGVMANSNPLKTKSTEVAVAISGEFMPMSDLISVLERINKFDVPKRGSKLLKDLKFDEKAYKKTDDDGNETEAVDKDMVRDIKKCSRILAKLYDKMTAGLIKVTDKAYGKTTVSDEKQYKEDLEAAKKAHKDKTAYNKDDDRANRMHVESYFEN